MCAQQTQWEGKLNGNDNKISVTSSNERTEESKSRDESTNKNYTTIYKFLLLSKNN